MLQKGEIGCTGRVSPLQLQVTYINITLTTLICPLQPRTKTSAVGPRETQVGKSINNFGITHI